MGRKAPMATGIEGKKAIIAAPLFHMNGLFSAKMVMINGGTIVLMTSFTARGYIRAIDRQRIDMITSVPTMLALVMRELPHPRQAFIHLGGDFTRKGSNVEPGVPSVLPPLPKTERAPNRLDFARWLVEKNHPLTARVMVNRLWHYTFGVGLVDTPSDFGANGSRPTHPELLDWLADEFVRSGWSMKHVLRLLFTSATFRQASTPQTEAAAIDADGRLLWRYTPRRLEGEAIRDGVLAASGALDLKIGGPGFYLHNVQHENVVHYFPKEEFTPAEFRRMVYLYRVRAAPDGVFGAFDCPDGNSVTPRRSRSNTPLQALNLFNSRFVVQQAEIFAKRLMTEAGDDVAKQIALAFRLCFARKPDAFEIERSTAMIRTNGLPSFCRALFNASEFLFVF